MTSLPPSFPSSLPPFCGRTAEVGALLAAWRAVQSGQGPQTAVILAESGLGKTRLAHEFFNRIVQETGASTEGQYWPSMLGVEGNNLLVNPDPSACTPSAPMPFLWWGIRLVDPLSRNCVAAGVLSGHYERDLKPHLEATYRTLRAKGRTSESLKVGAGLVLDIAADFVPFAGLAKSVGEAALELRGIYSDAKKDRAPINMAQLQQSRHASLNEQILEDLQTFFTQTREQPVPLILLIDDTQFSAHDPGLVAFVAELCAAIAEHRWPVLLLVSHWEREWGEADADDSATIAAYIQRAEREGALHPAIVRLRPIEDLHPMISAGLPGLTELQRDAILRRVDGNPRFLTEIMHFAKSPRGRGLFERRDPAAALTEHGFTELLERSVALHDLVAERLENSTPAVQQAVALASLQGVEFLQRLVGDTATQLHADGDAVASAIADAESPHAYIATVEDGLAAFAQRIYYEVAREYLPSCFDPDEAMRALGDTIQRLAREGDFAKLGNEEQFRFMALTAGFFEQSQTQDELVVAAWALSNLIKSAEVRGDVFGSHALAVRLDRVLELIDDMRLDADLVWLGQVYAGAGHVHDRDMQARIINRMVRMTYETYQDDANAWSAWMLAKALVYASDFYGTVHNTQRVQEVLQEAHMVLSQWADADMDLDQLSTWEDILYGLIHQQVQAGKFVEALAALGDVVALTSRMKEVAPDNTLWVYCRSRALQQMGSLNFKLGNLDDARVHLEESVELSRMLVNAAMLASFVTLLMRAVLDLALIAERENNPDLAGQFANESVEACRALYATADTDEHRDMLAQCLARLARLHQRMHMNDMARVEAQEAMALYQRNMELPWPPLDHIGLLYELLANLDIAAGDIDSAHAHALDACRWLRADVDRASEPTAAGRLVIALVTLIGLERQRENHEAAESLIVEADARYEELPESFRVLLTNTRQSINELR